MGERALRTSLTIVRRPSTPSLRGFVERAKADYGSTEAGDSSRDRGILQAVSPNSVGRDPLPAKCRSFSLSFSYTSLVVEASEGFCHSRGRLNPMNDPAGVHRGESCLG